LRGQKARLLNWAEKREGGRERERDRERGWVEGGWLLNHENVKISETMNLKHLIKKKIKNNSMVNHGILFQISL